MTRAYEIVEHFCEIVVLGGCGAAELCRGRSHGTRDPAYALRAVPDA